MRIAPTSAVVSAAALFGLASPGGGVVRALAALALLAPAEDTPIEPIDSTMISIALTLPEWEPVCVGYAAADGLVLELSLTIGDPLAYTTLMGMADAYFLAMFEDGVGENAALTAEAEELLLDALHGCV